MTRFPTVVVLVGASMVAGIYFWFGRPSPPQADVDRPNPAGGYSALDVSVKEAEIHPRRDNGYPAPAVPNHDREILLDDERYAVVFAEGDLDEETKDLIVQDLRRTFGRAKINDIIPSAIHDDYFQLRLSYVPSDWPGEITISKEENTLLINDDVTTKYKKRSSMLNGEMLEKLDQFLEKLNGRSLKAEETFFDLRLVLTGEKTPHSYFEGALEFLSSDEVDVLAPSILSYHETDLANGQGKVEGKVTGAPMVVRKDEGRWTDANEGVAIMWLNDGWKLVVF